MRLAQALGRAYDATMDQNQTEEAAQLDFPHFNPRTPTQADDIPVITAHMRTLESLEQRHAREQFARGRAVRYCAGPGQPVVLCLNMADLEAAQKLARTLGWK